MSDLRTFNRMNEPLFDNDVWVRFRCQDADGYVQITTLEGERIPAHNYVWQKHNGPIPDGYLVHHINGIQNDNRLINLALVKKENHKKIHWYDWANPVKDDIKKQCEKCKLIKPSSDFTGVSKICSDCKRKRARERYQRKNKAVNPSKNILNGQKKYVFNDKGEILSRCAICKKYLSIDKFPRNSSMKLGIGSYCKKCAKTYHKRWMLKNVK